MDLNRKTIVSPSTKWSSGRDRIRDQDGKSGGNDVALHPVQRDRAGDGEIIAAELVYVR